MNKVVYNACYGGFSISEEGIGYLRARGITIEEFGFGLRNIPRHNNFLVEMVEALCDRASGRVAELRIKIIDGNKYRIDEYDGYESVLTPTNCVEWEVIS